MVLAVPVLALLAPAVLGMVPPPADNAALLAMPGERSPYPRKFGAVAGRAYAALILADGNPPENLRLLEDSQKYFLMM